MPVGCESRRIPSRSQLAKSRARALLVTFGHFQVLLVTFGHLRRSRRQAVGGTRSVPHCRRACPVASSL
eukprot:322103-Pyramimonas_sp.AAC.1